jgi:predicted RNA-binding protein YlqC (UPF0109 family)
MSNIDEQFVDYVVKSLVSNPSAVVIVRTVDEKGVLLELTVDPEDLGRVIGKRGATAQSLRTLLRALGTKNEARYNLKIIDNGPEDHPGHQDRRDDRPDRDSAAKENEEAKHDRPKEESESLDKLEEVEEKHSKQLAHNDEIDLSEEPKVPEEEQASTLASDTRKELADLDDLDL